MILDGVFFGFCTKGNKMYYFDWNIRKQLLKDNPNNYHFDAHESICHYFNLHNESDKNWYFNLKDVNFYNYCPRTKSFYECKRSYENYDNAKNWVSNLHLDTILNPNEITDSANAFEYCYCFGEHKRLKQYITNSLDAYKYCLYVKDDLEIRKNITDDYFLRLSKKYLEQYT